MADAFPASASTVGAELAAAIEKGRPGLEKFVRDATPDQPSRRERGLVELVIGLEKARWFASGDLLARLVDLQLAALRELKVPEAELAAFQPGGDEKARLLVLAPLVRRLGVGERERGPHAGLFPWIDRVRGKGGDGGMR